MIGSSSITPRKEGYLFQKLSCSTELEIRALYVSPGFCFKANRDALLWIFSRDSISFIW